jgi:hypothetical protein
LPNSLQWRLQWFAKLLIGGVRALAMRRLDSFVRFLVIQANAPGNIRR